MTQQLNAGEKYRECSASIARKLSTHVFQQRYGNIYKQLGDGRVVQSYPDIPHVKQDQKEVERAEGFIGGFKHGPNDCFKLNKDLETYDIKFIDAVKASVQLVKTLNN